MNDQPRYKRLRDLIRLALSLSEDREGRTIEDIQSDLAVSRRTAERMLSALREALPQLDYRTDGEGRAWRWYLPQNALRHVLSITTADLAELEMASRRWREEGATSRAGVLDNLIRKLRVATTEKLLRRVDTDLTALMEMEGIARRPGPHPRTPDGLLESLRDALLSCVEIEFSYGSEPTARRRHRVRPLGILQGARPYLVASVVNTLGDPTLFRLDRLHDFQKTESAFDQAPDFDLQAFADRSFGVFQEEPFAVCLRFNALAAVEAQNFQFHPTQTVEHLPDGRLLIRFTAGGRQEMLHHLVTWNEGVEVLEPKSLRLELSRWAQSIATHHAKTVSKRRISISKN